jgi:membrane-bound inhibitor of C-type lysozyme
MIMRRLIALSAATVMMTQSPMAQTFRTYQCRDGSQFVAAFFKGDRAAHLQLDGKAIVLSHRPSLSGSRYRNGAISLRITNAVAILKRGRRSTECSAL